MLHHKSKQKNSQLSKGKIGISHLKLLIPVAAIFQKHCLVFSLLPMRFFWLRMSQNRPNGRTYNAPLVYP